MLKASKQLSLVAQNCNWSVIRTVENSILICTWFFGGVEITTLIGQLSHISLGKFGEDASVNLFLQNHTLGKRVRMSKESVKVSLGTLRNMSASALLKMTETYYLYGIQRTGFLSVDELDSFMNQCLSLESTSRICSVKSWEAGELVTDMLTESTSTVPPTANGELDMWVG